MVEGDTDDWLYLIVEGRAEGIDDRPSASFLWQRWGRELFGELSLLEAEAFGRPRLPPSNLLLLPACAFPPALDAHARPLSLREAGGRPLVTKLLKQASPFSTLDGERLRLAARLERLEVSTGETIIRQGEAGEECYVLRSGRVEVLARERRATNAFWPR